MRLHLVNCPLGAALIAAMLSVHLAAPAVAQTAIYTFDTPQFILGETTPLLNRAPNSGLSTFRTSFTASPSANGFLIDIFAPNGLFTGQMTYDPITPVDTLTLVFNQPVTRVQTNFAVITPGRLTLTSLAGTTSQNSAPQGGAAFQGGILTFNAAAPFTTMSFQAFDTAGAPTLFAIDNLMLTVPEPTTFVLMIVALGLSGFALKQRRRSYC